jgi:hypothetical protein
MSTAHTIIDLLKKDHREVSQLMKKARSDGSAVSRKEIWDEIVHALEVHMAFEEGHIYPVLKERKKTADEALEAVEEHRQIKHLLAEGSTISPEDERWKAQLTVLAEDVHHHVEEEEEQDGLFAHLRQALDLQALRDLAETYQAIKAQDATVGSPRGSPRRN